MQKIDKNRGNDKNLVLEEIEFSKEDHFGVVVASGFVAFLIFALIFGFVWFFFERSPWALLEESWFFLVPIFLGTSIVCYNLLRVPPELHRAALAGDIEKVKKLCEKESDLNQRDIYGLVPLHYATLKGHKEVVDYLLSKGADIDYPVQMSMTFEGTALFLSLKVGNDELSKFLIEKGCNLGVKTPHGADPFYYAISFGRTEIVKILISKGFDVNGIQPGEVLLPLTSATLTGSKEMVALLLDNGAEINKLPRSEGGSPLYYVAGIGQNPEILEFLIERGADPNLKSREGETPLSFAVRSGQTKMVEILLANKVECNCRTPDWRTPLHQACLEGFLEIAILLINAGADVNARDCEGWTTLHFAVQKGIPETIAVLLKNGADPLAEADEEVTPLSLARAERKVEIVSILERHLSKRKK